MTFSVIRRSHQWAAFNKSKTPGHTFFFYMAKVSGWMNSATSRCILVGCRYWPSVSYITAMSNKSSIARNTSSLLSPKPNMMPVLVRLPYSLVRFILLKTPFVLWPEVSPVGITGPGLHIVRDHFLPCTDHSFKGLPVGFNIRNQGFNSGFGALLFTKKRSGTQISAPYL